MFFLGKYVRNIYICTVNYTKNSRGTHLCVGVLDVFAISHIWTSKSFRGLRVTVDQRNQLFLGGGGSWFSHHVAPECSLGHRFTDHKKSPSKSWARGRLDEQFSHIPLCTHAYVPESFMTLCNGSRPVKDSLTVLFYCRADLSLAQIFPSKSNHQLWIPTLGPVVEENRLFCCRPFSERSRKTLDWWRNGPRWLSGLRTPGQKPLQEKGPSHILTFVNRSIYYGKIDHMYEVQGLFISLFVSIIPHNYSSVLSG